MQKSGLERLAPLSGLVSVILMLAAAVVIGLFEYMPSAETIAGAIAANAGNVAIGGYLGTLSSFFLIWFAGSLMEELRRHEQGTRLSGLALAGGVAAGVGLGIGFLTLQVAGTRAGVAGGLDPVGAVTLYDLATNIEGVLLGIGLAVTIAATAVVGLRRGAFPAWFNWISVVLTIVLLSPFGYMGVYLVPVWLAVTSVWLYLRGRSA